MAKKRNIIIKQGLDEWVMTYGDMMSLLLTFFVLIVSFSSMQETKFEQAAASLADAFGVLSNPESVIEFDKPIIPNHDPTDEEAETLYEVRSVEKFILEQQLDEHVEVEVNDKGVMFRLDAPFVFSPGSADLKEEPRKLLDRLARFFRKFPYEVRVEGHTDSVPIASTRFPSNWELSAARSVTVARYFQGLGIQPQRISAIGRGEFHPLADNATPEGRERNRRVEIYLELDRKDMPKLEKLPFATGGLQPALTGQNPDNRAAVRPIINPVTERLGTLDLEDKTLRDKKEPTHGRGKERNAK